ncbi:MAG: ABC transporter permease [Desulfohalobiaceae bacterium]
MHVLRSQLKLLILLSIFLLLLQPGTWELLLTLLTPQPLSQVYSRTSFWELLGQHAVLVGAAGLASSLVGLALGILVTRPWGREFLPAVDSLASMGQTFPPVAVLALAVPAVGFGFPPTFIALLLYGMLPVVRNSIAGLQAVPASVKEAAAGMGMSRLQILLKLELPLASGVLMAGVRTSVVINTGTATLGATIGAGGLGAPIMAGLIGNKPAFVLQGAILAGLFAVLLDRILDRLQSRMARMGS